MASTKKIFLVLLSILILMPLGSAHADAAPPQNPSGGDISPEGQTEVEMLAEKVVIDFRQSSDDSAQVTAWFLLRNTGTIDEHLMVRFPLNGDPWMNDKLEMEYELIDDVSVWIGNRQLPTQTVEDDDTNAITYFLGYGTVIYWAVFDVDFPVGEDVELIIKYTLNPTDLYGSSQTIVHYILATGAGWKGPIGSADVILRFPYIVNEYNVPGLAYLEQNDYGYLSDYKNITIVENEYCLHWDNLEPTDQDNIRLNIVKPHLWQDVLQKRLGVIAFPNNVNAWLDLARSYYRAGTEYHGMFENRQVTMAYIHAFQRTLELDPENADLHMEFAQNLYISTINDEYYLSIVANEISIAMLLDPDIQDSYPNFVFPILESYPTPIMATPTKDPADIAHTPTKYSLPTPTPKHSITSTPDNASPLEPFTSKNPMLIIGILISALVGFGAGILIKLKPRH